MLVNYQKQRREDLQVDTLLEQGNQKIRRIYPFCIAPFDEYTHKKDHLHLPPEQAAQIILYNAANHYWSKRIGTTGPFWLQEGLAQHLSGKAITDSDLENAITTTPPLLLWQATSEKDEKQSKIWQGYTRALIGKNTGLLRSLLASHAMHKTEDQFEDCFKQTYNKSTEELFSEFIANPTLVFS